MRFFVVALFTFVAVSASPLEQEAAQFQAFKLKHSKVYADEVEEAARFAIFQQRLSDIEEHNALYEQGLTTYKKGVNQFTDWTDEERKAYLRLHPKPATTKNVTQYVKKSLAVPDSVDFRTQNYVSEVKSQGDCGSCWAFAVTGAVEGAYARKNGQLLSLSEQQLVDCTTDINLGCNGGYLDLSFPYVQQYGLELESSYPYTGVDGTCQYDSGKAVAYVDGYVSLQNDEEALLEATYAHGPIGVAIDADYIYEYSSGIFQDSRCTTNMNHGMLVVGYGTENNVPYWILKNSWGSDFGEQGYMRMIRGTNECGITDDNTYPIIN